MPTNLSAKYREHMTPDERALVHVVDALIAAERPVIASLGALLSAKRKGLTELFALRKVVVKRVQVRMRWREKCATSGQRRK